MESKLSIKDDLIAACEQASGNRETAIKAVRVLFREFGGAPFYIAQKLNTTNAANILSLFKKVTDTQTALAMREKVMTLLGGHIYYIPLEKRAFKDEIALEIYLTYDGTIQSMRSICKEKRMSFNHVYNLWKIGQKLYRKQQETKKCL